MEAKEFSQLKSDFLKQNAQVVGISRNSVRQHHNFIKKQDLSIELLSDPDHSIHDKFKVMKLKKMFGKEYMGVERSTFIFDTKGEIIQEFRNVKPEGHAQEVLDYLMGLNE